MSERPPEDGPGCIGLPGMMALLVLAAAIQVGGLRGALFAVVAVVLLYLIIGALVWFGKRRPGP